MPLPCAKVPFTRCPPAHLVVFHGIREAYGRGSADTSLSAVFVYGRFLFGAVAVHGFVYGRFERFCLWPAGVHTGRP